MDQSGRVWKWTGAALAVACLALGIANFILTRVEEPAAYVADAAQYGRLSPEISSSHSVTHPKLPLENPAKLSDKSSPDGGEVKSRQSSPRAPLAEQSPGRLSASHSEPVKRAGSTPEIAIRKSQTINLIKPLGIVEKADGRVQAVIQDGEWTRLVEEGEVLADNSRVLKVSAEGVEISGRKDEPSIVLASSGDSSRPSAPKESAQAGVDSQTIQPESEWAWSGEQVQQPAARKPLGRGLSGDDLPGLEQGEAAYKPPAAEKCCEMQHRTR